MIEFFEMLQLPRDVEGDVDGPGTDGQGGCYIALQRVTHHQQFRRVYLLVVAECQELLLALVAGDFHIVEIF